MEITSQQILTTTRGVETSRPPASFYSQPTPGRSASDVEAEDDNQTAQKREEQRYEQAVQQQLQKLQSRDTEVRAHEAAHVAAGGQYVTSGPTYTYQRGPNGRFYAIGGEVGLDVSAIPANPQATLDKAEVIQRAALAPAQPSPQDLQVAANAARLASKARIDIAIQQREQQQAERVQKEDKNAVAGGKPDSNSRLDNTYGSATLAEPARDVFDIVA